MRRLQNILIVAGLSLLGLSCGSSSSSEYIRVSSSKPAQLKAEQKNAVNTIGEKLGSSGANAARHGTSTALVRTSPSKDKTHQHYAISESFKGEEFEGQKINCSISGSVQTSGSYSGNFSAQDDGSFGLSLDLEVTSIGDNCTEENGSFYGPLTASMSLNMNIQASQEEGISADIETILSMNGEIQAQGKDEEGHLKDVQIRYKDFRIRTSLNSAKPETYAGFSSIYNEDGSNKESLKFLQEHLECSGSITIDGVEHDCGSILALMLE